VCQKWSQIYLRVCVSVDYTEDRRRSHVTKSAKSNAAFLEDDELLMIRCGCESCAHFNKAVVEVKTRCETRAQSPVTDDCFWREMRCRPNKRILI
jgi:hypothetical protein